MKANSIKLFALSIFLTSCSTAKLASRYKSENFNSIKDQKVLVISRTPQENIRKSYEKEISKKLKVNGFDATASHLVFPDLKPLSNKTTERIANTIALFRNEGFDIVLLTSLKDIEEQEVARRQEGYQSMLEYYGNKYVTLKGYYDDVNAPPKLEPIQTELEPVIQKEITFILEAVTYNLALEDEQKLLSVLTTEITNPGSASSVRKGFAKIIAEELK